MRPFSTLKSGAFRLALFFAGVFAVGATLLVIAIETSVARYARQVTTDTLLSEASRLRAVDRVGGRQGIVEAIAGPARTRRRAFHYLLLGVDGRKLKGDLPRGSATVGWSQVDMRDATALDPSDGPEPMRTYGVRLSDGALLVVGSDTYDVEELRDWLDTVALWSGLGITILALGAGYQIAAIFNRRLERVNAAAQRIMEGSLAERLPVIGMSAEFDRLSRNLNDMLDRIEALMNGMRRVSSDIAHDLRTPLTRLQQHLESARAGGSIAAYRGAIDDAMVQVEDILTIFRALLRIGALEAGVGRGRFRPVDLGELLERVLLAYQPVAEDAGKAVSGEIERLVIVDGDAELLAQLFTNLIENALAHSGAGTSIRIELTRSNDRAVATVADDGIGIPEAERENVLRQFYRLDPSRAGPGSGLGLALVAAIAALHQADLELRDNGPGLAVVLSFRRFHG